MAPLAVAFNDTEGQFYCLKRLCQTVTVVSVHDGALVN